MLMKSNSLRKEANWTCEINENHLAFTTNSGKQYIETHHLIPIAFQDEYENTIDFVDNVVALCPSCHQLVHHTVTEEKEPILRKLFKERESKYKNYGIELSFENLLIYYK